MTMLIAVSRISHELQTSALALASTTTNNHHPIFNQAALAVEVGIENVSLLSRHDHLELVSRPSIIIASALADFILPSTPPFKPTL